MTIKKVLALLLALILIVGLIPTVAMANEVETDPIAANATVIKLQEVESAKKGSNLDWAFVSMSRTTDAPAGYNGESVYTATSGHIGGSNGGVCTTVDLTSYDFTGKSVYLRYYIPAYAGSNPNWQLAANTRTDGNTDATGTGGGYTPYANVVYDEWTYIDITQGLDAIKRNLFSTDIALIYWAGLAEGSGATCTVYVDGLYVVETDPIAANGTLIKLQEVESVKRGLNLDWAFAPMEEAFSAPFGYNGESVHAATSGHIGGSNGGVCTTVDLTSYNFTGKNVYLRYYISSYTGSNPNWQLTVNTRTDGNEAATGTAVGYTPYTNITYNEWTYLDITEGLDAIKRNLFSTDIALVYWAGIGEGSEATCTVYVDGLYVVDIPKGVNLLYNEDFEKAGWAYNRDDWSNNPDIAGGRFDWSATGGVDNSAAWVGTPGTNANQNAALWLRPADKLVTLDAGCRYIVSAKVYRENTDAVVYIGPRIDDSWMIGESSGTTKTGEWETINMVFEMSETKAVNIMVRALNYTTGTVKIDDVSLCQLDVEKAFDIIKFNGATITGISDTYVTTQLTFGAKVWFKKGNVFLCEQKATSGCGDGTGTGYQYAPLTLISGTDVEVRDGKEYASSWTVLFNIADCKANHSHFDSLWGDGKPDSCVVRITDWLGDSTLSNNSQVERMVLDAKAVVGIDGQLVAAEYVDSGMDVAWVDAVYAPQTDLWADENIVYGEQNTYVESRAKYNLMNCDTGRSIMLGNVDEFTLVAEAGTNMYSIKNGDSYINLTVGGPVLSDTKQLVLLYPCANERYQIVVNGNQVIVDDDSNSTAAAALQLCNRQLANQISSGWYITKSGETRPLKVMPLGDSLTYGVTAGIEDVEVGYRKKLSEDLTEYFGRVVFVGSEVTATTTLSETGLLRHAGFPGYTVDFIWSDLKDTYGVQHAGIKPFIDELTTKYTPDIVCLMLGTNDASMISVSTEKEDSVQIEEWLNTYAGFIRQIEETLDGNGTLICSTTTPTQSTPSPNRTALNEGIKNTVEALMAENLQIVAADNYAAVAVVEDVHTDEFHLNGTGYAAMANEWYRVITANYTADMKKLTKLTANWTTEMVEVPVDTILDLNGYTVTAENLVSYGNIVDSSKGEALIKVSGHKEIRRDNSAMALYDAGADGYRFFDYTTESLKKDVDDNTKKFGVRMLFNEAKAYELLAASDNANTAVKMFIDIDGTTYEYTFNPAILTEYAQKAGAKLGVASDTKVTLVLTITGYEKVVGKTVTVSGAYGSTTGVASDLVY